MAARVRCGTWWRAAWLPSWCSPSVSQSSPSAWSASSPPVTPTCGSGRCEASARPSRPRSPARPRPTGSKPAGARAREVREPMAAPKPEPRTGPASGLPSRRPRRRAAPQRQAAPRPLGPPVRRGGPVQRVDPGARGTRLGAPGGQRRPPRAGSVAVPGRQHPPARGQPGDGPGDRRGLPPATRSSRSRARPREDQHGARPGRARAAGQDGQPVHGPARAALGGVGLRGVHAGGRRAGRDRRRGGAARWTTGTAAPTSSPATTTSTGLGLWPSAGIGTSSSTVTSPARGTRGASSSPRWPSSGAMWGTKEACVAGSASPSVTWPSTWRPSRRCSCCPLPAAPIRATSPTSCSPAGVAWPAPSRWSTSTRRRPPASPTTSAPTRLRPRQAPHHDHDHDHGHDHRAPLHDTPRARPHGPLTSCQQPARRQLVWRQQPPWRGRGGPGRPWAAGPRRVAAARCAQGQDGPERAIRRSSGRRPRRRRRAWLRRSR